MEFININRIQQEKEDWKKAWNSKKPFRYFHCDNFLHETKANEVLNSYPDPWQGEWDNTTYTNQKNKYQKRKFDEGTVLDRIFKELNSVEFLSLLAEITGIPNLMPDPELFGGGLHQSIKGAFLDVHIDYNIHPKTKQHRRLNVLVYLNKDWKDEYEGHLELWEINDTKKERIERIAPLFNRMAMFETNEISYHGHPHPLNTPKGLNRKSLAVYYYTDERPAEEVASEHNTIYVNTTGTKGKVKNLRSGFKALIERIKK
ncbi:MAG: 2OG-Fe(II) oxygenase [Saprospiraceae bacterium]|nr:2OG-Fe(II) oxygenase [Saprospiraceae bacterium]